ncbi:NAD(P)/FAD-dependent oxidoreductase [Croceitalea rosinachiae]|uniref:FAD-dependent oxidoreductase n=1 Tax=Croceitalea rosinachiae TaxID=3075596 RepID=A0ABU3AB13_9FLAO|nr:FAD-dependent oxidoreductase [Croceitalea sp. F388]MDT0607354.1 FAD-dependent oxidoreductase [Croceitalea sp. F388]
MSKTVIIIGGGVVGLCTAYYLQKEGCNVTVIDKSTMDAGASYVNAGYLTPSHIIPMAAPGMISTGLRYMFNSSSPFYMKPRLDLDFLKWAWNFKKSSTHKKVAKAIPVIKEINVLSRELFMDIKKSGDLGIFHLERKGLLMLYQTNKMHDHEMEVAEKAKFLGLEVKELGQPELSKIEPDIAINAKGAIHYECDAHSTPSEFMARMKDYLITSGVKILKEQEVLDIDLNRGKQCQVKTTKATYFSDEVVLAAGSWSGNFGKKLKLNLSLQAGKGYRINVEEKTRIKMPAILMEAKMAVTPMKGYTRFAGTMEFTGINHEIRKERIEAIAKGAENYYEGLKISQDDKNAAQCGLRPVTPDGLPYIGKSKKYNNLTIATGHAMMGWSLGPITGKLVSELVCNNQMSMDISSFNPERKF